MGEADEASLAKMDICDFIKVANSFQDLVAGDNSLSTEAKNLLLMYISITKHSRVYWEIQYADETSPYHETMTDEPNIEVYGKGWNTDYKRLDQRSYNADGRGLIAGAISAAAGGNIWSIIVAATYGSLSASINTQRDLSPRTNR